MSISHSADDHSYAFAHVARRVPLPVSVSEQERLNGLTAQANEQYEGKLARLQQYKTKAKASSQVKSARTEWVREQQQLAAGAEVGGCVRCIARLSTERWVSFCCSLVARGAGADEPGGDAAGAHCRRR